MLTCFSVVGQIVGHIDPLYDAPASGVGTVGQNFAGIISAYIREDLSIGCSVYWNDVGKEVSFCPNAVSRLIVEG